MGSGLRHVQTFQLPLDSGRHPQWKSPWNLTESMGDLQDPKSWRYENVPYSFDHIFSGDIP